MKTLLICAFAALASASMASSFFDDFNRADSGDLGANWTLQNGSIGISSNMAMAPSQDLHLATVNGYSDTAENTTITFDVFNNGSSTQYAAAVLGYANNSQCLFVKVQNNGGSGFGSYGFYYGNNGGGEFGSLANTYTSARVTVSYSGTTATMSIDGDINGSIDETLSHDYGSTTLGTGAGLGAYGSGMIDNYTINAVPEPTTMVLLGLPALALLRKKRKV